MKNHIFIFLSYLILFLSITITSVFAQNPLKPVPQFQGSPTLDQFVSNPRSECINVDFKNEKFSKIDTNLAITFCEKNIKIFFENLLRSKKDSHGPKTNMGIFGDFVAIDAVANGDFNRFESDLKRLGAKDVVVFGNMVSFLVPISKIGKLAKLSSLKFARQSISMTHTGSATGQHVSAMDVDEILNFGQDGAGLSIGILSDSFGCIPGGVAAGEASGDLPTAPSVTVLMEEPGCSSGSDEGRAMIELVHDVVPAAAKGFHTAFTTQAGFAQGILDLDSIYGADIIVDDVIFFAEPMFQDGVVAQAVNTVVANGVPYFSSAGNSARQSYEDTYVGSGSGVDIGRGPEELHDFDSLGGVDFSQSVTIPMGSTVTITLQWDEPFFSVSGAPGSQSDYDIILTDAGFTTLYALSAASNINGDPVEILQFTNILPTDQFGISILKFSGPDRFVKYIYSGNMTINEFDTQSSTTYGHANASGAMAVGAAFFYRTPQFSADPATLENFSSAGGTPIFFDTSGMDLISPEDRMKPDITGPDGVNTTFFGGDIPDFPFESTTSPDSDPNFFGTSAAAPNVAAVAAMMLQCNPNLTPVEVYSCLETTADDMTERDTDINTTGGVSIGSGFDNDSGNGYLNGPNALICACGRDYGDAPNSYLTTIASGGPSHGVLPGLQLGSCVDSESDGFVSGNSDGDNVGSAVGQAGTCGTGGDEDGVSAFPVYNQTTGTTCGSMTTMAGRYCVELEVTNFTNNQSQLAGWIDFNNNGSFEVNERSLPELLNLTGCGAISSDSTDNTFTTGNIPAGCVGTATLQWIVPATPNTDSAAARFRITTDPSFFTDASPEPSGAVLDGEVEDYFTGVGSLPITLNSFSSSYDAGGLRLDWQTGMEVMNVGFNIYGYIEGKKIKLNKEIIPSKRPDSVVPQYYEERIEVPDGVKQLGISSVDTRGKEDYFGPFEIGASYGEEVEVKKVNWERVKEEYTQKMISKGYVNKGGVMRSSRVGSGSYISKLVRTASKTGGEVVCNVGVREEGMYRVSYEELALEGCDFNGEKPNKIAVTFKGEPVARRVKGVGGSFKAGSYIDFYGKEVRGDDVLYTVENVYQIKVDRSNVKKHTVIKGIPQITQESYIEEVQINKNEFYSMNVAYGLNGEKDPWYENTLFATPSSNAVSSHTIVVDNDVDTQASGLLRVNLAGISSHNGAGADHEVRLKLNGVDKGIYKNDGVVNWDIEVVTNPGEITPGVNTLVVEATGNTGYSFDLVFVNHYTLSYERPTVANGDVLNYTGNGNGYKVSGFSARAGIEVYGEQDGNLYKINGNKSKEGAGNFSISFKGIGGEANYYAGIGLNKGNVYISEINKSITEGSADVIVLTHTVFEGLELNSYVENIENRGHTVKVVNVQDVYETYGYGMPLPEAITTYLKASKSSIGNEYVVIVGATVTDPPTSEEVISFVPTEYEFTQGVIYYTPSDGVMMDFNGDNIPELAVSRLPVRLSSEISTFVNKLNNYTPKASALLVAEDPSGGLDFGNQLDQIEASTFGGSYSVSKVYLENQGEIPVKKQEMIDILNLDEPGLVMMDGHANPSSFVFAGMMTSNDASGLTNSDSAVFIPLACFMTYYPTSGVNTLSHQLLFNPQGGSVAITGAITFSGFNENGVYAESITKKMMSGKTLGRAVLETKQENPGLRDQLINWETIGDLFTTLPEVQ